MIIKNSSTRMLGSVASVCLHQHPYRIRGLHGRAADLPTPNPTPFVPDPSTFLKLIGRNLSQHTAKFATWQSLFSLTSAQLRELGLEPARSRRYLLWWRDRFRKGVFGIGGDLKHVKDGEADLEIVEIPQAKSAWSSPSKKENLVESSTIKRMVINRSPEPKGKTSSSEGIVPVEGMKIVGARTIVGPFIQSVKGTSGSVAKIKVQEGMWEVKRGEKVDGGERRKVQVRRKRLLEERKTSRK